MVRVISLHSQVKISGRTVDELQKVTSMDGIRKGIQKHKNSPGSRWHRLDPSPR